MDCGFRAMHVAFLELEKNGGEHDLRVGDVDLAGPVFLPLQFIVIRKIHKCVGVMM